jgi:hypothetical protein
MSAVYSKNRKQSLEDLSLTPIRPATSNLHHSQSEFIMDQGIMYEDDFS